jgi:hypothetical protein
MKNTFMTMYTMQMECPQFPDNIYRRGNCMQNNNMTPFPTADKLLMAKRFVKLCFLAESP